MTQEEFEDKLATKYYCNRYNRKVELYDNHCIGCSLFPFNIGECPSRINLDNYGNNYN